MKCELAQEGGLCLDTVHSFNGSYRCQLHLPLRQTDGHPTERANWPAEDESRLAQSIACALVESQRPIKITSACIVSDLEISDARITSFVAINCTFVGHVTLRNVEIDGPLILDESNFCRSLRIEDSSVRLNASLQKVSVTGQLCLASTVFHDDSHFGDSKIRGVASLEGATFHRYFSIRDCNFKDYSILRGVQFIGYFNCKRTVFTRDALFDNSTFESVTSFDAAQFMEDASFSSCQFHRPPTFQSTEFRGWLNAIKARFTDIDSVEAYTAYRTLRLIFVTKDAKREEMEMFRLEQRALLCREPSAILALVGRLYCAASQFGTSVGRPIICLFVLNFFFFLLYLLYGLLAPSPKVDPLLAATTHLFRQIFSPFAVWTVENEPKWVQSGLLGLQLLSSIQSAFSILCLALLSIALHWRFRKT